MAERGRPHECDEAVISRIERAARAGVVLRRIHNHAGVDKSTFFRWMARGKEGEEPFATMMQKLQKARGDLEVELLEKANDGESGWQGSAWILNRSMGYNDNLDEDHGMEAPSDITGASSAIDELADALPEEVLFAALAKKRAKNKQ